MPIELNEAEAAWLRTAIDCAYSEGWCGEVADDLDRQSGGVLVLFKKLGVSKDNWYYKKEETANA